MKKQFIGLFCAQVASFGACLGDSKLVTVFYQGMNNTQIQAARLVGKEGFEYPYTGERVSNLHALECILNLSIHPEIDEVELLDTNISPWSYLLRPYALAWFVLRRISDWYSGTLIIPIEGAVNLSGKSMRLHQVKFWEMNLGQQQDLAEHKKRVARARHDNPGAEILLYGVSRGALTTFTAYATERYEGVKAVILEGCPSSIPDVIRTSMGEIAHKIYRQYSKKMTAHDPDGISALACVDSFPKQTPVLFITSEKDKTVPVSCTLNLAKKLAEAGHEQVYCLVLKNCSHIGYCWDDKTDAQNYQAVVHAFYKKCGVAGYNEVYAAAGEALLEQSHILK